LRISTGIQLEKLIVHIVNPREPNGFILSDCCIPLHKIDDLTPKLSQYFARQIGSSLNDSATKAAKFRNLSQGSTTLQICQNILHNGLDFTIGSRKLAEHLNTIISKDKRIAPGNLAMCIYKADNYPSQNFIALMKIDPSDVFRHTIEKDEQDQQYVSFQIEKDVMPTTKEKLQKCACIRSLEPRNNEYDMMLLDRQIQNQVAQFFTKDFLEAELALDDQERTQRFYRGAVVAMNDLRSKLTPGQNQALYSAFENAIKQESVNIDTLIDKLPIDEEYKEIIQQKINLPDREFDIPDGFYKKLYRRNRFKGDYGLVVSVNTANYADMIIEEKPSDENNPYWEITIRTKTWEMEPN
jgi:37-kD nucleoid-associated bacterial protein